MPITSTDIQYFLSGGATNANPNASLGGVKSSTVVPLGLFDDVTSSESEAGDVEYRCIYVHNSHGSLTMQNSVVYIEQNTLLDRIAIAAGSSAIGAIEQTIVDEGAAPTGVTFSQPSAREDAIELGNIPPGQYKAVWIRRSVAASSGASNDTYNLRVECDTAA